MVKKAIAHGQVTIQVVKDGIDANLLDWVGDWNNQRTQIDGNVVIAPKIFAGFRNSDDTLTGTAIGRFVVRIKDSSGNIKSEQLDGLYGFKSGYQTFCIDNDGNVGVGRGEESIKYNSVTGKIEFGRGVSLNWQGATFIDSEGIFTGSLSADTVTGIQFNASQIISGTISAELIDVVALKTTLITASNIEALTLNVTKGKVGGWIIDNDSIFLGVKNNIPGVCTGVSGSITLGSNGFRGNKWRLESNGSGSLAGGNIAWDSSGDVTFGTSVTMYWTDAANTAASQGKLYVRGTGLNNAAPRIVQLGESTLVTNGVRGLNLMVLNRSTLAVISHKTYDVYGSEANCNALAVALDAITSDRLVILTSYDAIRINTVLSVAIQRCGGDDSIVTDERIPYALIGIPTIGKNNGLLAIYSTSLSEPYAELSTIVMNGVPQGVHVNGKRNSYITGTGIYTGTIHADQVIAGIISSDRIGAGSISAVKLDAGSIRATIINADYISGLSCSFTKGQIGGWTIGRNGISNSHILLDNENRRLVVYGANSGSTHGARVQMYYYSDADYGMLAIDSLGQHIFRVGSENKVAGWILSSTAIYKNNVSLGSDGSITNSTKWRLNNDGSGQLASGNISWNSVGTVSFSQSVSLNWKNDIESAKSANYGYRYYKRIIINGESGKYYPVVLKGGEQTVKRDLLVRRDYSEQAPNDWDNHSETHKGGLILLLKANFGGWGGQNYSWDIYELSESYSAMFGGAAHCGNYCMFAIFLRGGGETGAVYHLYSDQPIENSLYSPSPIPSAPQIAYNSDLIFISGESKANAPSPRTRTDDVMNEIRRHRFIVLAQSMDSTLSDHPLTYIGSSGIYTGVLSAIQINAGTLSADRIGANSIHASKLDAGSIKSSIINADYVSGLSCRFTKGTIGGWKIGTEDIGCGNPGEIGAIPLQIRSVSSGTGYWYTSGYKPYGICLTWHQSSNAGHLVFGQVASSGNGVKTGFIGIQMMSWDNEEYFCLSANFSKSGGKEVYNRIAGWAFDQNHIWKNNVSLGSDGSVFNGTYWRLNNDGSGQVANGNISWNPSGGITFGASVTAQWTTGISTAQELASAMAFGKMLYRDPTFFNGNNSIAIYNNASNGMVVLTRIADNSAPNDSKYVLKIQTSGASSPGNGGFTFGTMTSARKVLITRIIAKIPVGYSIEFATNSIGSGGSNRWLSTKAGTGDWKEYIFKVNCGTANFSTTNFYYLIGSQGSASSPVIWYVSYATVIDLTSTEKYTTTINSDGVYSGVVHANQLIVDSALIVGGSSYDGSISVRDASNAVKVTLNRSGITAIGGSIGGWNISEDSIYAGTAPSGHEVCLTNSGYFHNSNGRTDYWGLKADGTAVFGCGRILFRSDGSGYVARDNISWDTRGTVTIRGTIIARAGKIAGFTIKGNKMINTASDSSIEFSSMIGNASLFINSSNALLKMRADSARTGISIETYAAGARCIYIIANAGSRYAIESYGPIQLGQRSGERWCVPGVLYAGSKYSVGTNNNHRKLWGEGLTVTSFTHIGSSKYRVIHNLRHSDYTVIITGTSQDYRGYFKMLDKTNTSFIIQNVGQSGNADISPFDYVIIGRNAW